MDETLLLTGINILIGLPLILIGFVLYRGKGGFLLAGWNTMPKEKKKEWDEKKLLRFNGKCIIALGLLLVLMGVLPLLGIKTAWVNGIGWFAFMILIIWMVVYQNTKNRFHK